MKAAVSTYTLTIRPLPQADDPGGIRRLRMALKALRRSYGLQCIRIEPAKATELQTQTDCSNEVRTNGESV